MKSKIAALICVAIMVACPFVAIASDSDADSTDVDAAAMVKFDNLSTDKIHEIFDVNGSLNTVENYIFNKVYYPLLLNESIGKQILKSKLSNFCYDCGGTYKFTGEKEVVAKTYEKISVDFDLRYEIRSDEGISVIGVYNQYYEGNGVNKMMETFGTQKVKYGDIVEIKGTLSYIEVDELIITNMVKNSENMYYGKTQKINAVGEYSHDLTVIIGDKIVKDKLNMRNTLSSTANYDIVTCDEKDYTDSSVYEICSSTSTMNVTSDGTKEINGKNYSYNYTTANNITVKKDQYMSYGPMIKDYDKEEAHYYELLLFSGKYHDDDVLYKVVTNNGGTATKNSSEVGKAYDRYSGQVNKQSGDDNTAWYAVGILVALIVIAIVLMYVVYRNNKN